jgi:hypothetical protein
MLRDGDGNPLISVNGIPKAQSSEKRKQKPLYKKFKVVRGALSKDACDIAKIAIYLQRDVAYLFSNKDTNDKTAFGDNDSPVSFSTYANPVGESILVHLKPLVESIVGEELYEGFSYARIYSKGSVLPKHYDKFSAEWTATLCLYNSDTPWSIFMDGEEVQLYAGDFVVYDGLELLHWREDLTEDKEVLQLFLHYVEVNGENAHYKYDKRPALGTKKIT